MSGTFFGEKISSTKRMVEIPKGFSLQILMCAIENTKEKGLSTLYCRPDVEESGFILCHLDERNLHAAIQMEFHHNGKLYMFLSNMKNKQ